MDLFSRLAVTAMFVAAGFLPAAVATPVFAQDDDSGEMIYRVQALLEEVRDLRGQVESQGRELENLRRKQRDQYLDIDRRLQSLENGGERESAEAAPRTEDSTAGRAQPDRAPLVPVSDAGSRAADSVDDGPEVRAPLDEKAEVTPLAAPVAESTRSLDTVGEQEKNDYDRAFQALRETRYPEAAEAFSGFLQEYPDSPYASNALYWLAETYYVTRDFETAMEYFNELLDKYPDSGKQGDALLKIGFSNYELTNWSAARAALEQVRSQHPGTTLARLAESRLRDMRLAGHY